MSAALLVIDTLNADEREDAEPLNESVRTVLEPMCAMAEGACERELPVIYVNDNSGDWSAGRQGQSL